MFRCDASIRQKYPFAYYICGTVELPVDELEAQVGHADIVGIGKGQCNFKPAATCLMDGARFFSQTGKCFFQ